MNTFWFTGKPSRRVRCTKSVASAGRFWEKAFGKVGVVARGAAVRVTTRSMLIDKLEKAGRFVLWLTLTAAVVLGIVGAKRWSEETKTVQAELAASKDELRKALEPKGPERLPPAGMGPYHSWLSTVSAVGHGMFTNVSPRSGHICLQGVLQHPDGQRVVTSLPACAVVNPYASFKIEAPFLMSQIEELCGKDNRAGCRVSFIDAP